MTASLQPLVDRTGGRGRKCVDCRASLICLHQLSERRSLLRRSAGLGCKGSVSLGLHRGSVFCTSRLAEHPPSYREGGSTITCAYAKRCAANPCERPNRRPRPTKRHPAESASSVLALQTSGPPRCRAAYAACPFLVACRRLCGSGTPLEYLVGLCCVLYRRSSLVQYRLRPARAYQRRGSCGMT
jgi:hypothetical protein